MQDFDYDSLQVTYDASPITLITCCGAVLKKSDNLEIMGLTFDSKITFENHLCSVPRAAMAGLTETWYLEELLACIP